MLVSLLHLFLTIRAVIRSWSGRFWLGVVGGLLRLIAMLVTTISAFTQGVIFVSTSLRLEFRGSGEPSVLGSLVALIVSIGGPLLSLVVAVVAYRRFQDVPMAKEEELQRPFAAWLPVACFDALNLALALAFALL